VLRAQEMRLQRKEGRREPETKASSFVDVSTQFLLRLSVVLLISRNAIDQQTEEAAWPDVDGNLGVGCEGFIR
jgi:hypothetical protein